MTNEFKVGQAVSGHDYDNLPLGAQVTLGDNWFTHTKISGNRWRNDIGRVEPSGKYRSIARTLAHLPEPEDKTDAYVEPEPLKEGDAVLVWARVDKTGLAGGTRVYLLDSGEGEWDAITSNDAIVRPDAGQVPPWVNVATANVAAIARVLMDEGGMEHAAAFAHAESLDRAGVRAEGGAS